MKRTPGLLLVWFVLCCGALLHGQEVGKPAPEIGQNPEPTSLNAPSIRWDVFPFSDGAVRINLFVKVWDQESAALLSQFESFSAKAATKPYVLRAWVADKTPVGESAAFVDDLGITYPVLWASDGQFAAWKATSSLPMIVVTRGDEGETVAFVGTKDFDKPISEAIEKSEPTPFAGWAEASKDDKKAFKEVAAHTWKFQFAQSVASANTAIKNAGDNKKSLTDLLEHLNEKMNILEGKLIAIQERHQGRSNLLRDREVLELRESWFEQNEAWLKDEWDKATKDPALQFEWKVQSAYAKLVQDVRTKPRKEQIKAFQEFAEKNSDSLAANWASGKAISIEVASKKMNEAK